MTVPTAASYAVDVAPNGTMILTLDGPFAAADGDGALDLWPVVDDCGGDVIVDLRGLTAIDDATATELALTLQRCEERGRCAVVVRPNDMLWDVLCGAGFDRGRRSTDCLKHALSATS